MWNRWSRPSYSDISTKLGELTVALIPRPVANPFANCVLPAPRSPNRAIRSPGRAAVASRTPRARVESASLVVTTRSRVETTIGREYPIGPCAAAMDRPLVALRLREPLEVAERQGEGRAFLEPDERRFETHA